MFWFFVCKNVTRIVLDKTMIRCAKNTFYFWIIITSLLGFCLNWLTWMKFSSSCFIGLSEMLKLVAAIDNNSVGEQQYDKNQVGVLHTSRYLSLWWEALHLPLKRAQFVERVTKCGISRGYFGENCLKSCQSQRGYPLEKFISIWPK